MHSSGGVSSGFGMLLVVAIAYLAARRQYVVINRAGEGFLRLLRIRVFEHIQRQSLAFFDRHKSGVLVSRMTADIESMSELVQWGLLQFVSASILVTFALVVLLVMLAVVISADLIAAGDHSGWASASSAAAPATCGADIDVPLRRKYSPFITTRSG